MKTVFANGVFDLLHAGHVRLLEFARSQGDYLIVAPKRGYDFWVFALKPKFQRVGKIDIEGMGVGGIVDVFVLEETP